MNLAELQDRIARWEDLHTDFKERIESPDELARDLVCFANTDGGQLILGVAKDRSIVGVADPDAVNRDVDNVAYNNCEPPVTVVQEVINCDGKPVLVVNVPKGAQRLYRTNRGRYYIRTSSGCRDASREELLRLFQATESLYYDETPLPRLLIGDLDLDAFDRYLEQTGQVDLSLDRPRLLRNWGLVSGDHPTVAGLVLFGRAIFPSPRSTRLAYPERISPSTPPTGKTSRGDSSTSSTRRADFSTFICLSRTRSADSRPSPSPNCRRRRCGRQWSMP